MRTAWSTSMAAVIASTAAFNVVGSPSGRPPYSHARSSRSWRRARPAICRGSSDRWISTSDCSTESWRWAASVGPLLLAHAQHALLIALRDEPTDGRRGDHGDATDGDGDGADGPTDVGQPAGALGERGDAGDGEHHAGAHAHRRRQPSAAVPAPASTAAATATATTIAGIMMPSPGHRPIHLATHQDGQRADGDRQRLAGDPTGAVPAGVRVRAGAGRRHDADAVQDEPDPAGEGQQRRRRRARRSARPASARRRHRPRRRRCGRRCAASFPASPWWTEAPPSGSGVVVGITSPSSRAARAASISGIAPIASDVESGSSPMVRSPAGSYREPREHVDRTARGGTRRAGWRSPSDPSRGTPARHSTTAASSAASPSTWRLDSGVDPLWVRLAFVGLSLASGLGIILYVGLWLILIVGRRPGWAAMRWIGAAVAVRRRAARARRARRSDRGSDRAGGGARRRGRRPVAAARRRPPRRRRGPRRRRRATPSSAVVSTTS